MGHVFKEKVMMGSKNTLGFMVAALMGFALMAPLPGCTKRADLPSIAAERPAEAPPYLIGPLDSLTIFVWKNPDLSRGVTVRPDGRISVPLIEDLDVAGKTPTVVAREVEKKLGVYIKDPLVTVIMSGFKGPLSEQVRVVGEAVRPQALPYQAGLTLLDVMIAVGGLTEFADGNSSTVIRTVNGKQKLYRARLADLIRDGDISANRELLPGDTIIVPESFF